MLELLELRPGMRGLEIGAGTGYNAALLAELAGDPLLVTTVEAQPEVAEQAHVNLQREGCGGVRVLACDGLSNMALRRFKWVTVSNSHAHEV
ncbi:hypothetical protein LR032_05055, partial [Candidatus Bipolaricaulota bacterium]|nr:hypothetical protein [Candidatus Bipolaricaulota bacterium]